MSEMSTLLYLSIGRRYLIDWRAVLKLTTEDFDKRAVDKLHEVKINL